MKKSFVVLLLCLVHSARAAEDISDISAQSLAYEDNDDLYEQVFGHRAPTEEMFCDLDVLVDGEKVGKAPVFLGKNENKVQASALKDVLKEFLDDTSEIAVIGGMQDNEGYVNFKQLSQLSTKIKLNRLLMCVEILPPLDNKKTRSLFPKMKNKIGRDNVTPAKFSSRLNMRAAKQIHKRDIGTRNETNFIFTSAVNLFGLCAEGETSYRHASDSRKKDRFHRDYLTFVYDWADKDVLFKYGDIFNNSFSYQSVPHIWGFSINKDVEREKSEKIGAPIQITLLRTSTIEIYSGNNLIKTRHNVPPGTYTLDDIPYGRGANDIRVKIIDDTGREQMLDEGFFYESSYVPKGSFAFNGSWGYPKSHRTEGGRYDKDRPLLSLSLKYGLFSATEVDFGFLRNKLGSNRSYALQNSNMLGRFHFRYATSNFSEGVVRVAGKVYFISYSSPSIKLFDNTSISASAQLEKMDHFFKPYLSVPFSELSSIAQKEPIEPKNTSVAYNVFLNDFFSINLGFHYSHKSTTDKKYRTSYAWNMSKNFSLKNETFSNASVSTRFDRTTDLDGRKTKTFGLYCSLSFKHSVSLSAGYADNDGENSEYLSLSKYPERTGLGYTITANREPKYNSMSLNSNYTHHLFKGNLNCFKNTMGDKSAVIGGETALYFADGRFAVSKVDYSNGGFVIVTPCNALAEHKLRFMDKETESGFLGGGAVLNNYRTSQTAARVDLRDIPNDIDVKQTTIISRGEYKRGFIIDIEGNKSITAGGTLIDINGEPFAQVVGYATNLDNKNLPPISFFTNADGYFLINELRSGRYKVTLQVENTKDFEIQVQEGATNEIINLGTIICEEGI